MNMKIGPLLFGTLFFVVTSTGCNISRYGLEASSFTKQAPFEERPPTVQVKVDSPINHQLKMHWKISNLNTKPMYIYSSLLRRTSFVEINIDADKKMIEVRFLRLKLLELTPLSFPETAFMRLDAEESREGYFVSDISVEQIVERNLVAIDPVREKIKSRITPGTWTVRALIAYGYEIESVQNNREKGHPIDPVVKWQKVAYSEPVSLTIQK